MHKLSTLDIYNLIIYPAILNTKQKSSQDILRVSFSLTVKALYAKQTALRLHTVITGGTIFLFSEYPIGIYSLRFGKFLRMRLFIYFNFEINGN